jgi:hypothetical protein
LSTDPSHQGKIADDLAEYLADGSMTKEEKDAINEAARLADLYIDVQPETFKVSGSYLFQHKTT